MKIEITDEQIQEAKRLLERWAKRRKIISKDDQLLVTLAVKELPRVMISVDGVADPENSDHTLSLPIEVLCFSTRIMTVLRREYIHLVGDLARKTEKEILRHNGMGRRSFNDISAKISSVGLTIGMKIPVGPKERAAVLEGSIGGYVPLRVEGMLYALELYSVNDVLAKSEKELADMISSAHNCNIDPESVYGSIRKSLSKRGITS